jgi:predicted translin family RNA/ssDNA-binding protein
MSNASNEKLDTIHSLVNGQLSQAVDRLAAATREIEELKRMVRELQEASSAKSAGQGRGAP